jgi:site-specific DNA recombinase
MRKATAQSRPPAATARAPASTVRCAIYTRKSSEEGLEQDFNSLDAQREACEAYITSQRHEGWSALPAMYDDGGISGATMQRPALQRLLADVADGKIDVVVVYKVDRLTRSLADFAKIVEIFDRQQVSFVSVTQAFNTTSSMGRLTLNVLLSFAQFEREVTGERIRDKIAASKRKGMWMGGQPPLGYDVKDRKLIVNEAEAETVRHIFQRYGELKSVRLLQVDLHAAGIVSKARKASDGRLYGAKPLGRGALYLMLSNRIYRGAVVHKGEAYPGEHPAILEEWLWDAVQAILSDNRITRDQGQHAAAPSLLAGLVFDAAGERLTPSHAVKRGTRYRYYVSYSLIAANIRKKEVPSAEKSGWRIPASALEGLVRTRLTVFLRSSGEIMDAAGDALRDAFQQAALARAGLALSDHLDQEGDHALRRFLTATARRIDVHRTKVDVILDRSVLIAWLTAADMKALPIDGEDRPSSTGQQIEPSNCLVLSIPATLQRTGNELRFVIADEKQARDPDPGLLRILARAHLIRDRLFNQDDLTIEEVAAQEKLTPSYITRLLRLTFLAPDILTCILDGDQPPGLTAAKLMADTRLPLEWSEQRVKLGIAG